MDILPAMFAKGLAGIRKALERDPNDHEPPKRESYFVIVNGFQK